MYAWSTFSSISISFFFIISMFSNCSSFPITLLNMLVKSILVLSLLSLAFILFAMLLKKKRKKNLKIFSKKEKKYLLSDDFLWLSLWNSSLLNLASFWEFLGSFFFVFQILLTEEVKFYDHRILLLEKAVVIWRVFRFVGVVDLFWLLGFFELFYQNKSDLKKRSKIPSGSCLQHLENPQAYSLKKETARWVVWTRCFFWKMSPCKINLINYEIQRLCFFLFICWFWMSQGGKIIIFFYCLMKIFFKNFPLN